MAASTELLPLPLGPMSVSTAPGGTSKRSPRSSVRCALPRVVMWTESVMRPPL